MRPGGKDLETAALIVGSLCWRGFTAHYERIERRQSGRGGGVRTTARGNGREETQETPDSFRAFFVGRRHLAIYGLNSVIL